MRFTLRTLSVLIILTPLTILAVPGVLMVRRHYEHVLLTQLGPLLRTEAANLLGREVRIGDVQVGAKNLYLRDVQIAEGGAAPQKRVAASARLIVVDFDLYRLLREKDLGIARIGTIRIVEPRVRIFRDRKGVFSFDDIVRRLTFPPPKEPQRPIVGRVEIENGVLFYDDEALPHGPKRPPAPLQSQITGVRGHLLFYPDQTVNWIAEGSVVSGQMDRLRVLGSYEPVEKDPRLFLQIEAERAALPVVARHFLPAEVDLSAGVVSGRGTLLWQPARGKEPLEQLDFQADLRVEGGVVSYPKLREPVLNITGSIRVANAGASAQVNAAFADGALHAEGTLLDFRKPTLNGWARGSGLQMQRLLSALGQQNRFPLLKQLAVSADVTATARGPLDKITFQASAPITIRGGLPDGPYLPEPGQLLVSGSGSLERLSLKASGRLPRLRFRAYEAQDIQVSAVYTKDRAAADFSARVAGGRVVGRANLSMQGKTPRYEAIALARGVDLSRVPAPKEWRLEEGGGLVAADLVVKGRLDQRWPKLPDAIAELQLTKLQARLPGEEGEPPQKPLTVDLVRARLVTEGERVWIMPLLVVDEKAFAMVQGRVNVRERKLDLSVEANGVDLAKLPLSSSGDSASPLQGLFFLRDGRVTGSWSDPRFFAYLRGYGPGTEDLFADYGSLYVWGDRKKLFIEEGLVSRLPAEARFTGAIRLTPRPTVQIAGDFDRLELQDLVQLARKEPPQTQEKGPIEVIGTAKGRWEVAGSLQAPRILIDPITVEPASIDEYTLDRVTASLRYDPFTDGGTWYLNQLVTTMDKAQLSASATFTNDQRFTVQARANGVLLSLLDAYFGSYVNVRGTGMASLNLSGQIRDGNLEKLGGDATLTTEGLTINGVRFGDLQSRVQFRDDLILAEGQPDGSPPIRLGTPESGLLVRRARYDRKTDTLLVEGALHNIYYDSLRRAAIESPYVLTSLESVPPDWIKPESKPFSGAINATFTVSGPARTPQTTVAWSTSPDTAIEGQPVSTFKGRVLFSREQINVVEDIVLKTEDTTVNVSGILNFGRVISMGLEVYTLPFSLFKRWLPPHYRDLDGMVDSVYVRADGDPSAPTINGTLEIKDVEWRPSGTGAAESAGKTIPVSRPPYLTRVESIRLGQWSIANQKLEVSDFALTFKGPPAGAAATPASTRITLDTTPTLLAAAGQQPPVPAKPEETKTYEVLAKGSIDFDWKDLSREDFSWRSPFRDDAKIAFSATIPPQSLEMINALLPGVPLEIREGQISVSLNYSGTWLQLTNPQEAETRRAGAADIQGRIDLTAKRIRYEKMTTAISDVDAHFAFTGDTLRAEKNKEGQLSSLALEVLDPKTGATKQRSDPLFINGELPLHEETQARLRNPQTLFLTARKLVFAETPLPVFRSGYAVGELFGGSAFRPGVELRVGGTLLAPEIAGKIRLQNSDFRPPDLVEGKERELLILPIQPSFNVEVYVQNKVRVNNFLLNATVRTDADPIRLRGTLERPEINGVLTVDEGVIRLPGRRFTIAKGGTVRLRYLTGPDGGQAALEMLVNLRATTQMTARSVNNETKRYTITVEVKGPLNSNDPEQLLTFRADPPDLARNPEELQRKVLSSFAGEEQIRQFLSGNFADQAADLLSQSLLPELFASTRLAEVLGLDEFTGDYNRLEGFTLRVSRRLFGPITVSYWQRLTEQNLSSGTSRARWQLKTSYRLRENLQFSWTLDEQRTNSYLLEGVFRFR